MSIVANSAVQPVDFGESSLLALNARIKTGVAFSATWNPPPGLWFRLVSATMPVNVAGGASTVQMRLDVALGTVLQAHALQPAAVSSLVFNDPITFAADASPAQTGSGGGVVVAMPKVWCPPNSTVRMYDIITIDPCQAGDAVLIIEVARLGE